MKREYRFWVYIMGSRSLNFYIGLTNNLRKRAWQHKRGEVKGFTQRYRIDRLLYFEEFLYFDRAEYRETELKKWRREKKIALIKTMIQRSWTWQNIGITIFRKKCRFLVALLLGMTNQQRELGMARKCRFLVALLLEMTIPR